MVRSDHVAPDGERLTTICARARSRADDELRESSRAGTSGWIASAAKNLRVASRTTAGSSAESASIAWQNFFGGRSVPLAGVAGRGDRARNGAGAVTRRRCAAICSSSSHAKGCRSAGLYASTATLYRSIGFEQAGRAKLTFRAKPVRVRGAGATISPCTELDPCKVGDLHKPLYDARARSWTGHLDRFEGDLGIARCNRGPG